MTTQEIKKLTEGTDYDFLRTNSHLKGKIIFLTLGGSHAYGTNIETSDVDVRGCALNSPTDLLGLTSFDQVVDTRTDTTVYAFNKFAKLILNCNPNTIEMLGCKPEHYFYLTNIGKEFIDNRKLFLSQRAVHSFGGYATQQRRRLENALAKGEMPQGMREEYMRSSMESTIHSFESRFSKFDKGSIILYADDSPREDLDREVFADISLKKFPIREFNGMLNDLASVLSSYESKGHGRGKKDDNHLNKHAMHLIRLYLVCLDILEKGDIITYREADRDLLMSIRNGTFQNEDGSYRQEFFDMVADYERRFNYAKNNTSLPERPNMKLVEEFVMDINRRSLYV